MVFNITMRQDAKDLDKIVILNKTIFDDIYEWSPFTLQDYLDRLGNKDPLIFTVTEGERSIGYSISYLLEDGLYIWILGILREYRNNGIATQLIRLNEQFVVDNNLSCIYVKVFNVSPDMQRLLIKQGYLITSVDISPRDIKYNAVHFRRDLKSSI